jgi:hypothetical protein
MAPSNVCYRGNSGHIGGASPGPLITHCGRNPGRSPRRIGLLPLPIVLSLRSGAWEEAEDRTALVAMLSSLGLSDA